MNPENMGHHLTMRHSSLWRKPLNYEKAVKRVNTCHGQLNEVASGGVCWKLRNNAIQTRSDFKARTRIIRQDCSKQLQQTLKQGKKGSRRTQSMLQTLKTEASCIDKAPKLVTGMKSLKQMYLLVSRDLNNMRYCIRKNPTITNHHERKSTSGFGRSACGRFYTS